MSKILVSKIAGPALEWAGVLAMGFAPMITTGGTVAYRTEHGSWDHPRFDRHEAADLASKEWIGVERPSLGQTIPSWRAITDSKRVPTPINTVVDAWGETFELAIMRVFIISRLGATVDIPDAVLQLAQARRA